ncbi:Rv2231c family pyridoxal phosphate-dependent protein CobC [Lolliginicoccus suaedae]|uniref:Rv2231c family pyridoxal phosphate-dependent protein CobC n=1 Tax=Lolliginicoccus suaedae TaxID=2605429 RepID=UPI001F3E1EF3|nr:Rv2231c family pyridoxal phosphate-dependent protein CobC [Lolliginicoccus suaedae]
MSIVARPSSGPGRGAGADALRHHGDIDAAPGLLDFAVNVHGTEPPSWVQHALRDRLPDLARYPDQAEDAATRAVIAARHGRHPDEVLLLNGAAEGFALLPGLAPRHAAVIHPSFTEPEHVLATAGIPVTRVILPPPYGLAQATIPSDVDLVVVGNPTNPTSVLHPRSSIDALRAPGRLVVVDEAFMDVVPGETGSCASDGAGDVLVLRSITKTWGLAGLRAGYALGAPELLERLARPRPHWPVGTLALTALAACSSDRALEEAERIADQIAADRAHLLDRLGGLRHPGIAVAAPPSAPFVLLRGPEGLRQGLRESGVAVRRCDTFPGLDDRAIRVAVRARPLVDTLVQAIEEVLSADPSPEGTPTEEKQCSKPA